MFAYRPDIGHTPDIALPASVKNAPLEVKTEAAIHPSTNHQYTVLVSPNEGKTAPHVFADKEGNH